MKRVISSQLSVISKSEIEGVRVVNGVKNKNEKEERFA